MRANEILNESILNELFHPVQVDWDSDLQYVKVARFEVNNIEYKFTASNNDLKNDGWMVEYHYLNSDTDPFTPSNNQPKDKFKVLSIVVSLVVKLIEERQPNEIHFSGVKKDHLDTLYAAMIKNLKKQIGSLGYTAEQRGDNFHLFKTESKHVDESATAGGSSAGSIATSVGGLGAGFDPNGDHGIYEKSAKKKRKKTSILRR